MESAAWRWPAASPSPSRRKLSRPSDRKSTRLNSSHLGISYAVFCLKKKITKQDEELSVRAIHEEGARDLPHRTALRGAPTRVERKAHHLQAIRAASDRGGDRTSPEP